MTNHHQFQKAACSVSRDAIGIDVKFNYWLMSSQI